MISKLLENIFVLTSISPVFLAIGFGRILKNCRDIYAFILIILFIILIPISRLIIKFSQTKLEVLPVNIKSVAPADKEVAVYLIAYILPVLGIVDLNLATIIFIVLLLYFAMLTTSNYHFNPILSIQGYHYYEIEIKDSSTECSTKYVLMTKRTIKSSKEVTKVVQISDYMLMEV